MSDLDQARQLLEFENLAFVIVREKRILARGTKDGVCELLAAIDDLGAQARNASLADRVVGKAVALIAVGAGIYAVDTPLASQSAVDVLEAHGIVCHARFIVPQILNRRGNGPCPLEQLTQPFDDPATAIAKLREFITARPASLHPSQ